MRTLRCLCLGILAGALAHVLVATLPQSALSVASPLMLPMIVAMLLAPCVFSRRWAASLGYFAALVPVWV